MTQLRKNLKHIEIHRLCNRIEHEFEEVEALRGAPDKYLMRFDKCIKCGYVPKSSEKIIE